MGLDGVDLLDLLPGQCLIIVDMGLIWTAGGSATWFDGIYIRYETTERSVASNQSLSYGYGLIAISYISSGDLYLTAVTMQVLHFYHFFFHFFHPRNMFMNT